MTTTFKGDLTGQTFNSWTVIGHAGKTGPAGKTKHLWLCRCTCGYERTQLTNVLRSGTSKMCDGCRRKRFAGLRAELKEAVEIIRFTVTSAETEAECISMVERRDAFLKKHEDTNV